MPPDPDRPPLRRRIRTALLVFIALVVGASTVRLWHIKQDVDAIDIRMGLAADPQTSLIYDAKGLVIAALYKEHRLPVPLEQMSEPLVRAVVAAEDRRFYEHGGVDPRRIASALWTNLRRGRVAQGASTITQQYARNAFLDRSRTWGRKVREAWLAHRLEQNYGKPAILQAYLNQVYFGEGYYGVEAASLGYFGKHAADLTAVEGATLASVINRPSGWALRHNPSNVDGHHRRSQRRLVRRVHASPRCGRVGGL